MSDPLRPFVPGDPVSRVLQADTLNAMLDGARKARNLAGAATGGGGGQSAAADPATTVYVIAHKSMPVGSVIGIDGPANSWMPASDKIRASREPAGKAKDPVAGEPFLVTLDPCGEGGVIRAVVSGAALVVLSTPGGVVGDFADVTDGDSDMMVSADSGPARVLWAEPDAGGSGSGSGPAGSRWATVLLLGADGSASSSSKVAKAYCLSSTVISGLNPAYLTEETSPGVWTTGGKEIRMKGLSGEAATAAVRYAVLRAPYYAGLLPVYHAIAVCCGTTETPPDPCPCSDDHDTLFCVTLAPTLTRADWAGTYELSFTGCQWQGRLLDPLCRLQDKFCGYQPDGAGKAGLSFGRTGASESAWYVAGSGITSCTSGGTLSFVYAYGPYGDGGSNAYATDYTLTPFPATLDVAPGACPDCTPGSGSGSGSGDGPGCGPCEATAANYGASFAPGSGSCSPGTALSPYVVLSLVSPCLWRSSPISLPGCAKTVTGEMYWDAGPSRWVARLYDSDGDEIVRYTIGVPTDINGFVFNCLGSSTFGGKAAGPSTVLGGSGSSSTLSVGALP